MLHGNVICIKKVWFQHFVWLFHFVDKQRAKNRTSLDLERMLT